MKTTIDVENRGEADRVKTALNDPATRAFVNVIGALLPLQPKARQRVVRFVTEQLAEEGATDGTE